MKEHKIKTLQLVARYEMLTALELKTRIPMTDKFIKSLDETDQGLIDRYLYEKLYAFEEKSLNKTLQENGF